MYLTGLSLWQEMNTAEHYNISTNVTIMVQDGDDQYPQFVPCVLLFQDETSRICSSPVYMVNVTEGEEVSFFLPLLKYTFTFVIVTCSNI